MLESYNIFTYYAKVCNTSHTPEWTPEAVIVMRLLHRELGEEAFLAWKQGFEQLSRSDKSRLVESCMLFIRQPQNGVSDLYHAIMRDYRLSGTYEYRWADATVSYHTRESDDAAVDASVMLFIEEHGEQHFCNAVKDVLWEW
ncbi:hypothetical protein CYMTET_54263 [Cymbomonas tetramitiformis]|uniref:Uncharacterized protein n=1 Tax=Cymbomonas tetramitiformis TaxID=36881 RepID=A0AAE0BF93_9CHLO|nr:hypothetical protein CYMTET_54263 [Cymbomonas tetramitiformis]